MVWSAWLTLAAASGGEVELLAEEMALGTAAFAVPALPVATDVGDEGVIVLAGGAGLALGTFGGVGVARWKQPAEGEAMAFTTAQLLGLGNGLGWGLAAGRDAEAGWIGLGGMGAGTVAGLLWMDTHPSAGDVALVRSGMLWGALAGVSARLVDPRDRLWNTATVVAGADLGALGGALIAAQPGGPSREQVARVQTAGLGGGVAGAAVGLALQGYGAGNVRTVVASTALGAGVGVGLGIANLRPLQGAGSLGVAPTSHGLGVRWAGTW